jgi:hypothetical protein
MRNRFLRGQAGKWIAATLGVQLPVVSEKRAGRKPTFLLGPCNRSRKAGLIEQADQLRA